MNARAIPRPPLTYVDRPALRSQLETWLNADGGDTHLALMGQADDPDRRGPVLLGAGASTLAASFASAARPHFEEGVLWLRVGHAGHLPSLQKALARALGFAEQFASIEQGRARLRDMFSGRQLLLVLDDVHSAAQLAALDVIDAPGRLLYTAANAGAAPGQGAIGTAALVAVPPLTSEQAAALLALWAQRTSATWSAAEQPQVAQLVDLCDRLPFGVTLAGTLARSHSLTQVLEFLGESNNDQRIFHRLELAPGLRELDAVYRNLDKQTRTYYRDLGVLPATEPLSVPALSVLWQREPAPTAYILRTMADHGLLIAGPGDDYHLHALHQRYVAARDNDPEDRHDRLTEAFLYDSRARSRTGADAAQPLSTGQRAYWLRNGPYHLSQADKFDDLRQLLTDASWLIDKLEVDGPMAVAAALAHYQQTVGDDRDAGLARAADVVRMAGEALTDDPHQLPSQLLGRLAVNRDAGVHAGPDAGAQAHPLCALLDSAHSYSQQAWLRPVRPTLAAPAGVAYATRQAHAERITAVAWLLHDGVEFALTAALDGSLCCWTETGQLHGEMRTHNACGISALAVAKHQTLVAIGATDGAIELWNPIVGERERVLSAPTDRPRCGIGALAISPDGAHLVSGSQAGAVALWHVPSSQLLGVLGSHSRAVTGLAITSDGATAVSASDDGSLRVWDLDDRRQIRRLWRRTRRTRAVALGPDDNLALAVSAGGRLDFWHLGDNRPVHGKRCLGGNGRTVTMSADGHWALAGAESAWIAAVDVSARLIVGRLWSHTRGINAVAMDRAGRRALSAADDQIVKFWRLYRPAPPIQPPVHTGPVHALAIARDPDANSDADFAVSQGDDGDLAIWDLDTGQLRASCPGAAVRTPLFWLTRNGQYALTSAGDHSLTLWRVPSGEQHARVTGAEASLVCACATDDGAYAIAGSHDGAVFLLPLTAGQPAPAQRWQVGRSWHLRVAVSGDRQRVFAHSEAGLHIFASDSGRQILSYQRETTSAGAFATSLDHRRVVLTVGPNALVFDVDSGEQLAELVGQGSHAGPIAGLAVTERHAIALSGDGRLRVWSLESGQLAHTLSGDAFGIRVLLGATDDGAYAFSQSRSGIIEVWNLASGKRAHALPHRVQILDWASDSSGTGRLLTGARDGRLIEWDLASGRRIATFKADGAVRACALARRRQRVAAGDQLGRVHILEPVYPDE